jgi:hypothetical protein
MTVANAATYKKTVADPNAYYESMKPLWDKARAVCGGEQFVKNFDGVIDVLTFTNLLIPFSPSMTAQQYNFYKNEAEFPGVVKEFSKMIVGGLLRKEPQLQLPEGMPDEAKVWILSQFTHDSSPMIGFLDEVLKEEITTSRAWVYIDYPSVSADQSTKMTPDQRRALKPYPLIWKAESIVNWHVNTDSLSGEQTLERVIIRGFEENFTDNEFHPVLTEVAWVHEVVEGLYQIRKFVKNQDANTVPVVNGEKQSRVSVVNDQSFALKEVNTNLFINGNRMTFIPAWPLNGSIDIADPFLTTLIDKEVALYNKVSRRNHLLYGAATYTPVVAADITDSQFKAIVDGGLGSWIHVGRGDSVDALKTPTEALADMDRAIQANLDEMAKLGVRMLAPENMQAGVSLEIRNAAQTASLATLNTKVSSQLSDIIAFMLNWRYDLKLTATDVKFTLSPDFNPTPLGADWLRLATEWYQNGILPRSEWISIGKHNDLISADYDDKEGQKEIAADALIVSQQQTTDYAAKLAAQG